MKRCTTCGESYPPTSDYWTRRGKDKPGWRARCKKCFNASQRVKRRKTARKSRAKRAKLPPEVRVVQDKYGNRRALGYLKEPLEGETFMGIGSKLLNLKEERTRKKRRRGLGTNEVDRIT